VGEEAAVIDVAHLFTEKRINRVPVTNREGRLTGIVSRADIVRASVKQGKPPA
jgi:CBS domain-containing protein